MMIITLIIITFIAIITPLALSWLLCVYYHYYCSSFLFWLFMIFLLRKWSYQLGETHHENIHFHRTQSSPSVQSIDWIIQRPFGATSFFLKKEGDFFEYLILFITLFIIPPFFIVFHILFITKKMGTPTTAQKNCQQLYPTTALRKFQQRGRWAPEAFPSSSVSQDLQRSVVPWTSVFLSPRGEWFFFLGRYLGGNLT